MAYALLRKCREGVWEEEIGPLLRGDRGGSSRQRQLSGALRQAQEEEHHPGRFSASQLRTLQSTYPDRFERAHLRTLQRRVQKWRGIMASKLVHPVSSESAWDEHSLPELAIPGIWH